jgi:hypothetical protein
MPQITAKIPTVIQKFFSDISQHTAGLSTVFFALSFTSSFNLLTAGDFASLSFDVGVVPLLLTMKKKKIESKCGTIFSCKQESNFSMLF